MIFRIKLIVLIVFLLQNIGHSQSIDTLIQVGKFQLHFNMIRGNDTPILFEAGNGSDGSVWKPLLQEIHHATGATLITYDRAGLGKSTIDTTTISFQSEIENLKQALSQLGFQENYFLVSHSFGSFYASEFAQRNKGKIKGAVFVDIATPCNVTFEYASRVKNSISKENWDLIKKYKPGLYHVLKNFPDIATYMANRYIPSSIPLTLIAAEFNQPTYEIGETKQDITNKETCLKEFGNLPNHRYVFAKNTTHKVWERNPTLVISEIIKLYNQTLDK